jgi:hypothetical protein
MIYKLLLFTCLLLSSPKGIDASKVRYGKLDAFKEGQTVYLVASTKVYLKMSAYKTITKEGLKKGSARYNILMSRCTALFKATLDKSGYSLIVEVGGVDKSIHKTEDVTTKLIGLLPSSQKVAEALGLAY